MESSLTIIGATKDNVVLKTTLNTKNDLLNVPSQLHIQHQFDKFIQNVTSLKTSLRMLQDFNEVPYKENKYLNKKLSNPDSMEISDKIQLGLTFYQNKCSIPNLVKVKPIKLFNHASDDVENDSNVSISFGSTESDHFLLSEKMSGNSKNYLDLETTDNVEVLPKCLQLSKKRFFSELGLDTSVAFGNSSLEKEFIKSSFFINSNFAYVPPTLKFVLSEREDGYKFRRFTHYLRWKMTSFTPKIVKNCLKASGFKETIKSNLWMGIWGKALNDNQLKDVRHYQKVSHFPGIFEIGRKDLLYRNLKTMKRIYGNEEFDFIPQSFILPFEWKLFRTAYHESPCKKWIIKPPASARGTGIFVITKLDDVPRKKRLVVQKYISNPFLINGKKFDLRIYVYITCFDPLRIYMYKNGLARFATAKYSNNKKSLENKFIHLTNFSINRHNDNFNSNHEEINGTNGYKWSLKCLWKYFKSNGLNSDDVLESIKDLVIKTVISCEKHVAPRVWTLLKSNYCCHELLGFDILLDEMLKPWLLEVNISPSLNSSSDLDMEIKSLLIRDIFNTAGFRIPKVSDVYPSLNVEFDQIPAPKYCLDTRLNIKNRTAEEKAKQSYFCRQFSEQKSTLSILESLTRCDLNILIETIDEQSRSENFDTLFPNHHTSNYLKYFETPRYYSILLHEWFRRYSFKKCLGLHHINRHCLAKRHVMEKDY